MFISDTYTVFYDGQPVGSYWVFEDGSKELRIHSHSDEIRDKLKELGFPESYEGKKDPEVIARLMKDDKRVKDRKQIIYEDGLLRMEREP